MSNISVLNRVICVPVHVIVHTFLIVGKPTESKRPTAGLSLCVKVSQPTETSRCCARFLTNEQMSHDIAALYGDAERENYNDYRWILRTRSARDVARRH